MITAWIGSLSFFLVMILYFLLVIGLPLGDYAMGGKHKVFPKQLRIASAISIVIQMFAILILLQVGGIFSIGIPMMIAIGFAYFFAFYLGVNTIMNALSKSKKEKLIMTPLSAITAVCFLITVLVKHVS